MSHFNHLLFPQVVQRGADVASDAWIYTRCSIYLTDAERWCWQQPGMLCVPLFPALASSSLPRQCMWVWQQPFRETGDNLELPTSFFQARKARFPRDEIKYILLFHFGDNCIATSMELEWKDCNIAIKEVAQLHSNRFEQLQLFLDVSVMSVLFRSLPEFANMRLPHGTWQQEKNPEREILQ